MAQRRMFSLTIVDTDRFLEMPTSAQALYYHLGMRADDDGFVASPQKVIKIVGAALDDLKLLTAKGYIIPFENGVCVITDWRQNNYIRSDRYAETVYKTEKASLSYDENQAYYIARPSSGIPDDNQAVDSRYTQVRLGKDRIDTYAHFAQFWDKYPKKKSKGAAEKAWKSINPSEELVAIMLEKLAQAKTCREWTKDDGQYIPYPATWLRAKGWEDEYTNEASGEPRKHFVKTGVDEDGFDTGYFEDLP